MTLLSFVSRLFVLVCAVSVWQCAVTGMSSGHAVDVADSQSSGVSGSETGLIQNDDSGPSRSATRVLIMRPTSAYGTDRMEDKWLLVLCEAYFHCRCTGIPGLEIVSPEILSRTLPEYKAFNRPLPEETYMHAARNLMAPYALYIECGYPSATSGGQLALTKDLQLILQLIRVEDSKDVLTISKQVGLNKLGPTFDRFIAHMLDSVGIAADQRNSPFITQPIFSTNAVRFKRLGAALDALLNADTATWHESLKNYRLVLNDNPDMIAGYFAGMQLCGRHDDYIGAARFATDLIVEFGNGFAPAYVHAVRYYRLAGNCKSALRIAQEVPSVGLLKEDIEREMGECRH